MGLFSRFTSQSSAAPAGCWRRGDFTATALGPELVAIHNRDRPVVTVPAFLADFVHDCEEFQSLEQSVTAHADRHGWDGAQVTALHTALPQALAAGMLVSTEELRKAGGHGRPPEAVPPRIATLGVSTGGARLPLLERAVRSFAENLRAYGREATFLISENSRDSADTERCRTALRAWSDDLPGVRFRFAGEREKRLLAERLSKASACSPEAAEFALLDPLVSGFSLGANRNALLLQTAGEMFASLDDDAVCRLAASPEAPSGDLSCVSDTDPYSRWLYASSTAALAQARWIEADYLAAHEQLLGREGGALLAAASEVDFARTGDALTERLLRSPTRVRATYPGHLGDPGIPASAYYLYYNGANRERFVVNPEHYRSVFGSRSVLSIFPSLALTDSTVCPGIAMALDHRELLPPFFPVLHAEDYSWGAILWRTCPGALLGHLPLAVCHEPGGRKPILTPADLRDSPPFVLFEFAHLLRQVVFRAGLPESGSAPERMTSLGRQLLEMGRLPAADFREFLREQALVQASDRVAYLVQEGEENPHLPEYWREDVHRLIEHLQSSVPTPDFEIPLDLQGPRSPVETRAFMQTLFARYGALLTDWTGMVEAARQFRLSGEEPMPLL